MPEQYLSTSRLGNVIQLIALGKQTGVLKVMRGQGSTREQGEIHFSDGQPVFASLGQLVGNAALSVLHNWGESQYVFLEGPLPQAGRPVFPPDAPGQTGDLPALPPGAYGPRLVPPASPGTGRPVGGSPSSTTPLPRPPGVDLRNGRNGTTGNLSWRRDSDDLRLEPLPGPPMRRAAFPSNFAPHRLTSLDRLDALPLDRRERMVLLLVDGRRSLADLVRLTRRSEQELQAILSRLAALGLIE